MKTPIAHRTFVSYIDRTRDYYAAQGYEKPYRWARHADVPFVRPSRPLAESCVTVVTTASPDHAPDHAPDHGQRVTDGVLRGGKAVWSGDTATTPPALFTDDLSWDKEATHTRDVDSFVPLTHLRAAAEAGRIGRVAPRFHGVPTDYSQRRTTAEDAPEILARCREDEVDVALLVPL